MVSIITSVYNCEKYIAEMINSILAQTYTDWELIIFDDASTDNTWNIVSQFQDSRIKKFKNMENQGLTVNLNQALKIANGEYIARIDGDDVAYPRRLEKQVEFMNEYSDVVLSGCWMKSIGSKEFIMQKAVDCDVLKINLLFNVIVFHPCFIMRRSILKQYDIKYNEQLKCAQDYDMEYQLSRYGKIKNIPEVLMKYRIHDGQVTVKKAEEQKYFASITRNLIINDLGIELTDEERRAWNHFGMFEVDLFSDAEIKYIKGVIDKIITINKTKNVYREKTLRHITSERLRRYIDNNKSINQNKISENAESDKYHRLFLMMTQWKRLNNRSICLDEFFKQKNIQSIAIYGMGHAGRALAEELVDSNIAVKYAMDRNIESAFGTDDIMIAILDDHLEEVDAVVVTAITQYENIKETLEKKIKCPIYSLEEVIYSM